MHHDCLLNDVLVRVYERLGTNIPQKSEKPAIKEETKKNTQVEPKKGTKGDLRYDLLSPSVERDDRKSPIITNSKIKYQTLLKKRDDESSKDTETPAPPPSDPSDKSSKPALTKRAKLKKSLVKPWEGLFEATLKLDIGPTVWQVTDLREGVEGGEKKWMEPVYCLLCNTHIE